MVKWFFILTTVLISYSCGQLHENSITIATSANMQFAMTELAEEFESETGIKCDLVISSSGKLTAQIMEGAPYDIFVSADMKYPQEIADKKLSVTSPKVYAYGKLVLWSYKDNTSLSLNSLLSKSTNHIAIANVKTAPYGKAAEEFLFQMKIYETVKDKLVFGESISQVNQFITSKSAELGFTAKSSVLSPKMKNKGSWIEIDKKLYSPIQQGVVQLNNKEYSEKFYNFLFSEEAKEILEKYGYLTAE